MESCSETVPECRNKTDVKNIHVDDEHSFKNDNKQHSQDKCGSNVNNSGDFVRKMDYCCSILHLTFH